MKKKVTIIIFALLCTLVSLTYADIIYLKNGEARKGKIKQKTNAVVILTMRGFDFTYLLNDVQRIDETGIDDTMDIVPSQAERYAREGLEYMLKTDYDAAIIAYQMAIVLNPNNADYSKGLEEAQEAKRLTKSKAEAKLRIENRAKTIAQEYLSKQPFRGDFEEKAYKADIFADHVDVYFHKKKTGKPPYGLIRVDIETENPEWVLLK